MNYENDYEGGSFDANYESDFEEVEIIDDYNAEKSKKLKPETKSRNQPKNFIEEHVITDESIEYVPNTKKPDTNSKANHESEELYEDSFQDSEYEIPQKKEPELKKPDTHHNFDMPQRKKDSIKAENPHERRDYENSLSKNQDYPKDFTDRSNSKQLFPIKASQSPIHQSKTGKTINVRIKTPNNLRSLEASKRNISPKNSFRILNNSTLDKIKAKPEISKKTRQILEKENSRLRSDLKTLNEQISQLLEMTTSESKNKPKKIIIDNKSNNESNVDKRLKIYESEYNMIKDKYNTINDPKLLSSIKEDIKSKEKKIVELEKIVKTLQKNQSKNKKIEDFNEKHVDNDKSNHQQLQDEYYTIEQQMKIIENAMQKEQEWYDNNCSKEAELQIKYNKLKALSENYQNDYFDKRLIDKFSSLNNTLANIGKIRNNTQSQLKIQEKAVRVKKESLQKEVALVKSQVQDKTQELKKIREDLENLLAIASANNLSRLVSVLNLTKAPDLERSLSSRSGSELRGGREGSRNSNFQNIPRNLSSNPKNFESAHEAKITLPLQKSSEKPYTTKPFNLISPKIQNSQEVLQKSKPQPKPIDSHEIHEEIEDFSNKKNYYFNELENENPPLLQKNPDQHIKNQGSSSNYLEKVKKEQAKSSLFQDLESSSKPQEKREQSPKKPSIFDELEYDNKQNLYNKPEIYTKTSMITELDYNNSELIKKHENNHKSSIFQELEKDNKTGSTFKPVINEKKPSIFDELEERDVGLENGKSGWNAIENKHSIFKEVESNGMGNKSFKSINEGFEEKNTWNDSGVKDHAKRFSPFRGEDSQKPTVFDGEEEKVGVFGKVDLPDPSVKRNRSHLLKKSEDKVAENAAKSNLFGNIYDTHEPERLNHNAESKLLTINRDATPDKTNIKKDEFKFDHFETKKHTKEVKKNFELEEEDLLL
ncbi:hypothetical protein SteCoe_21383 [Stentor coeruleus]|uniref:Uncharacterized protein n=1 Tax=Stentor coeruleus TaxID=5963 RepID=A0A1R2BPV8_9CILI|nr:hypothetical protein SteCoe_21383 [Stentor coeruleus]